jgi:acetylornithine deacetylase
MRRLRDLEQQRNAQVPEILASWPIAYPISIGRIEGGDWPSTVIAQVHLEGRYGVRLSERLEAATAAFEQALVGTGALIDWFGGRFASGGLDVGHPLVKTLAASHHKVTGTDPDVVGVTYGSDLRQLLAAGIPTVLYGPGDAALAHSDDEEVPLSQVLTCRDVLTEWLQAPGHT